MTDLLSAVSRIMDKHGIPKTMLKPCPFCGREASDNGSVRYAEDHEAWWEDGSRILEGFFVNCMWCSCSNKGMCGHKTRELAIENWNARPVESDLLAVVNELDRLWTEEYGDPGSLQAQKLFSDEHLALWHAVRSAKRKAGGL